MGIQMYLNRKSSCFYHFSESIYIRGLKSENQNLVVNLPSVSLGVVAGAAVLASPSSSPKDEIKYNMFP